MRPGFLALIPLAAAVLFAQARTTTTTTTRTTWNGTLVDASCQSTEHRETTHINPDRSTTTRTETTRTENVECPVSASTSRLLRIPVERDAGR